jgi:two-component system, response regulator PdtaR
MDRRYLLVDDNRAFAENVAEILRDLGDDMAVVTSGQEALALVKRRRFDAVVTDMRMPVMGGAQLVRALRRIDPGVPAIVVTAHVADRELAAARREGLLAVLSKPVPIHALLDLLAAARRDALVAVVEDDLWLTENLCEALRSRGFAAITAASVLEAEGLEPLQPFVALVDLYVPGGPAGEAMVRLSARFPGIPHLVVSGHDDAAPLPFAARFGKPFDTGELLAAVERCYGARPPAPEP